MTKIWPTVLLSWAGWPIIMLPLRSSRPGVSKVRPTGQMRPLIKFWPAHVAWFIKWIEYSQQPVLWSNAAPQIFISPHVALLAKTLDTPALGLGLWLTGKLSVAAPLGHLHIDCPHTTSICLKCLRYGHLADICKSNVRPVLCKSPHPNSPQIWTT